MFYKPNSPQQSERGHTGPGSPPFQKPRTTGFSLCSGPNGDAQPRTLFSARTWGCSRLTALAGMPDVHPPSPHSHPPVIASPSLRSCLRLSRSPDPRTPRAAPASTPAGLGAHGPGSSRKPELPRAGDWTCGLGSLNLAGSPREPLFSGLGAAASTPAPTQRPSPRGGGQGAAAPRDAECVCAARPIFTPQTK